MTDTEEQTSLIQDGLPAENTAEDPRRIRRRTRRVFFGVDLYLVIFMGIQLLMYLQYSVISLFSGTLLPEEPGSAFEGFMILLSAVGGILLSWIYFKKEAKGDMFPERRSLWRTVFQRRRALSPWILISCAALVIVLQVGFTYVQELLEWIFNRFGQTLQYSEALNADYSSSIFLLLYASFIGPIAEEIVYRGYLMRGLEKHGRFFAILISSAVFGLMHGDLQQSLFTFMAGLVFGWVAMEYSLMDSILLHVFNNAVLGDLLVRLEEAVSEDTFMVIMGVVLIISVLISIIAFRKSLRRIREYRKAWPTAKGSWLALVNIWVLLFLLYAGYEISLSIQAL